MKQSKILQILLYSLNFRLAFRALNQFQVDDCVDGFIVLVNLGFESRIAAKNCRKDIRVNYDLVHASALNLRANSTGSAMPSWSFQMPTISSSSFPVACLI